MPTTQKGFTFDALGQLKDAGAVVASAAAQVGGANKILDLGVGRINGRVIIDVTALDATSGDERYEIHVEVSNAADFSASVFQAAALVLGDSTVSHETVDTAVPRHQELMFTNDISGTLYRYLRIFTVVAGTTPTINYTANLVQEF